MDNSGPEIYTEQEIELIPGTGITEKVDIKLSGLSLSNLLAFKEVNLKVKEDNFDPKSIIVLRKSSITLPFDYTLPTYNKIDYTYGDTITADGEYIVLAADKALNISYAKFIIDTTKPVINNIEPNEYYKEVVVDVEDATLSTIQLQEYLLGDYRTTKFLSNGDVLTESGEYRLLATDKAGNQTTVIFNIDSKDPTITGVNDKYIYIKEVSPVISDTNLDNVIVTKDGSTIESKATYTEEGIYTITATDKANNSVTVGFEIDKDALKIENVENGKHYQTSVEPKITNRGEITIKLMKNESLVDYTDTISEAGNYVLTVTDEYGNEAKAIFAVDKKAPTINVEDKEIPAVENGTFDLLAAVVVTDDVDSEPELEILSITHSNPNVTVPANTTKISIAPDMIGTYTVTYKATDESGRSSEKSIDVEVFLSDTTIELDLSGLTSEYNGTDQTGNIKACIYKEVEGVKQEVICETQETANEIVFEVINLTTNETFVKNAGNYTITATMKNQPAGHKITTSLNYTISPATVEVKYTLKEGQTTVYDGTGKTYIATIDTYESETPVEIYTYTTPSSDVNKDGYVIDVEGKFDDKNYTVIGTEKTVYIEKAELVAYIKDVQNGEIIPGFKDQNGKEFDAALIPESEIQIETRDVSKWQIVIIDVNTTSANYNLSPSSIDFSKYPNISKFVQGIIKAGVETLKGLTGIDGQVFLREI